MKKKQIGKTIMLILFAPVVSSGFIAALVIGFNLYMAEVFGGDHYTDFDERRKLEMINLYGITLSDDAELVEYSANDGFSDKALLIISTKDCDSFMENCLPEDAEMIGENEFHYANVRGQIIQNEDNAYTISLITTYYP